MDKSSKLRWGQYDAQVFTADNHRIRGYLELEGTHVDH